MRRDVRPLRMKLEVYGTGAHRLDYQKAGINPSMHDSLEVRLLMYGGLDEVRNLEVENM